MSGFVIFIACIPIVIFIIIAVVRTLSLQKKISRQSSMPLTKTLKTPQPSNQDTNDHRDRQPSVSTELKEMHLDEEIVPSAAITHIFVSYRRIDSADIAGRIYDRLIGRFEKKSIFKDVDSIPLGLDFKEYLDKQVGECKVLLAVIGDRWLDASNASGKRRLDDPADFVRIEIESALERNIPVIPLLVRGASMPREEDLPPSLRKLVYRNGIPIRPDPDFHRDMDRLIKALEGYVG